MVKRFNFYRDEEGDCHCEVTWQDGGEYVLSSDYDLLRAKTEILWAALYKIAAWDEGVEVGSHFEEPCAAHTARDALSAIAKNEWAGRIMDEAVLNAYLARESEGKAK